MLFGILMLASCVSNAQQNKTDSLLSVLKTCNEDTSKVNTLNSLSRNYANIGKYELAMRYAQQAFQLSEKLNFKKGTAAALNNIGVVNWNTGNYEKALDIFSKSLKINEEIGNKKGIAIGYNNIGLIFLNQGNYEMALNNFLKSLKIKEEIGDKQGIGMSYLNMGNIYLKQDHYDKALDFFTKSLHINIETGNKTYEATNLNNIGIVYVLQGNSEKALDNYLKSLKIREEINDKNGVAMSYSNIGLIYYEQNDYNKALENQLKAVKINMEIGNKQGIAVSYTNIANIYMNQKKFDDALHYLSQSLSMLKPIGFKDGIKDAYASLSDLFEKKGDYNQAYKYHKLFSAIKDTLFNEQSSKQMAEMNTKYDSEKKDKELIKKDAEINKQLAESEKQKLQRNAFIIGFAMVLVLAFFIYRGFRQKQNANKLLEEKNRMIETQKELVEEKNTQITDSINYAKRIQQAILPTQELIKSFLPDSFIFFRPKDIVSGDFYWFSEKNDLLIIAVADCTGHGVPGAFMSMIGNTLLNEIVNVKNIVEPEQILTQLNNGIVGLLHQAEDSATQDDGMDITILAIDLINKEIHYAGANHFSYLINRNQLITLKGDVFSIGGMFGRANLNFTSQKIKIDKGSTIYLFSDGYTDQFGGEKNTKFLSARFKQLLQSIQEHSMEEQEEKLLAAFDEWKSWPNPQGGTQTNKQLDDVLVIGIRF